MLGCGIVGAGAGELIAEAVVAIEMGCTVRDVAESIHPHPTLSETLSFAAEVYLGTATEVYRPKTKIRQEEFTTETQRAQRSKTMTKCE